MSDTEATLITTGRERQLANLRRIPKGVSGNPGGKPKALMEVLAIGRKSSPAIMNMLVDLALKHVDPVVRIAAAKEVLNRTFGKPSQQVEVVGGVEHAHFVVRAPAVLQSAAAWEEAFNGRTEVLEAMPETHGSEGEKPE